MKKKLLAVTAVAAAMALSACGGGTEADVTEAQTGNESQAEESDSSEVSEDAESENESKETEAPEVQDVTGTYKNVSFLENTTYVLNDNGTYDSDKVDYGQKGTYTVSEDGKITLQPVDLGNQYIMTPYEEYYYFSNDDYFDEDSEYGAVPSFDENGRSTQSFQTPFVSQSNGYELSNTLTFKEEGTFTIQQETGQMQGGFLVTSDGDSYDGEYTFDNGVVTLKWNDAEYQLLFIDNKLYYNVLKKQTDENASDFDAQEAAMQAEKDEKYAPVDEALANEISQKLQGQWQYSQGAVSYTLTFDGFNITVESVVGGYQLTNKGTYTVCKDLLLVTYENGEQATMDYTYEDGNLDFSGLVGLTE